MKLWHWMQSLWTPDHECSYSGGEEWPEHCRICGRSIHSDPAYIAMNRRHLHENIEAVKRGESPQWAIDEWAL